MFDNIGGKIKAVALVVTWLGIIVSVIVGFKMISIGEELAFQGFLVMILGSLFSWLGSLTLYGFGQLIENTDILVRQGSKTTAKSVNSILRAQREEQPKEEAVFFDIVCPNCKSVVSVTKGQTEATCPSCKSTLDIKYK